VGSIAHIDVMIKKETGWESFDYCSITARVESSFVFDPLFLNRGLQKAFG